MSQQQNPQQNQQSLSPNMNLGMGINMGVGYIDLMINSMLMEQMKVVSGSNGFTVSTVIALIMILSINELKPMVGNFTKFLGTQVPIYIKSYVMTFFEKIFIFLKETFWNKIKEKPKKKSDIEIQTDFVQQKENNIIITNTKIDDYCYTIVWQPMIQSAIIFLNYILSNADSKYEKENSCEITKDSCKIKYKNIKFQHNEITYNIPDIVINFTNGIIQSYNCIPNNDFKFGSKDDPKCFADLMDKNEYSDKLKTYVKIAYKELRKKNDDENNYYVPFVNYYVRKDYFDPNSDYVPDSGSFGYDFRIAFLLLNMYPSLNISIVLFELPFINSGHLIKSINFYYNIKDKHGIHFKEFGIDIKLQKHAKAKYDLASEVRPYTLRELPIDKPDDIALKNGGININMFSKRDIDYNTIFSELLEDICKTIEKSTKANKKEKINIFELKISRKIKETSRENPKYLEYVSTMKDMKDMKDLQGLSNNDESERTEKPEKDNKPEKTENIEKPEEIKQIDDKNKQDIKDNHTEKNYDSYLHSNPHSKNRKSTFGSHSSDYHFMRGFGSPPPKTIIDKEEIITVEQMPINSAYKGFDTLYLRKYDKLYLHSILSRFSDCADIYQELDIPHKLGVLLYGEPGTGKSSTIKAIASYIKRDIYFVDLSDVKKNSELKQIFDHVNKGCLKGGVLVFEDIDCMTDIVKPRQKIIGSDGEYEVFGKDDNILTVMKNKDDNLSLSYFLNLLDGTLCSDNTLFIMTTNHKENLDPALIRNGRVDVSIELRSCDHYQIANIYEKITKIPISEEVLKKIPEFKYKPIDIITHILRYYVCNMVTDNMMDEFFA
jgi:SpoVK/Ycf46/Vps4 family AAA+-type ATPase